MSSRINTNIGAYQALNALNNVGKDLAASQLRLATGKRINSVGDDPSGYTIAKQMEAKGRQMGAALNNVGDAKSLVSTAEQALQTVRSLMTTIQEKQVAANNPASNVTAIASDINQMIQEVTDIMSNTAFGNSSVLGTTGSYTGVFQIGAGSTETLQLSWSVSNITMGTVASTLAGITGAVTATNVTAVETALQTMGSYLQRLDAKESNLNVAIVNIEASKSRIMDADIAREQVNATKLNILQQTSVAMLSQANQAPQAYLQLFK